MAPRVMPTVAVVGEVGVGKTTLVNSLLAHAERGIAGVPAGPYVPTRGVDVRLAVTAPYQRAAVQDVTAIARPTVNAPQPSGSPEGESQLSENQLASHNAAHRMKRRQRGEVQQRVPKSEWAVQLPPQGFYIPEEYEPFDWASQSSVSSLGVEDEFVLWDYSGSAEFRDVIDRMLHADPSRVPLCGALICFDVSQPRSFTATEKWIDSMLKRLGDRQAIKLVALQVGPDPAVPKRDASIFAKKQGVELCWCNAVEGLGIPRVTRACVQLSRRQTGQA